MRHAAMASPYRLGVVIPVFNDWDSLELLVDEVNRVTFQQALDIDILVIDDGSTIRPPRELRHTMSGAVQSIEYLPLMRNVGHQRAIAVGLVEAETRPELDAIIVMDSDGEDKPQDIPALVEAHLAHPDTIVAAARGTRSESWWFNLFYALYRLLFRLLIGKNINFGNFCLIPRDLLSNLTHDPNAWNHVAGAISHSRLPVTYVRLNRGSRYRGKSKMNFEMLVMHGLSAISVYIDLLFVRVLLLSISVCLGAVLGIIVVVSIVLFTDLAIPGWATNAVGILLIIIFQSIIFSSSAVFFVLSMRSRPLIVPAFDAGKLIKRREVIYARDSNAIHVSG